MGTYKINHSNMDWQGINHDQSINLIEFLDSIAKTASGQKVEKNIAPPSSQDKSFIKNEYSGYGYPHIFVKGIFQGRMPW